MRDSILLPCLALALAVPLHAAPSPRLRASSDQATGKPPVARAAVPGQVAPKSAPPKSAPPKPAGSQPGTHAPAAGPATVQPAPAQAAVPTEKSLLDDFDHASSPSDSAARAAAIRQLGESSRKLPDGGSSRLMARTLAKGLLDKDLEVRAAAVRQLAWGREVDTVVEKLPEGLEDVLTRVYARITRPDDESRHYVDRGSQVFCEGAAALANYRDDRSVDALVPLLRGLPRNPNDFNRLSPLVVGPLARALLTLGTHDAVEAAVRQTQTYVGDGQGDAARRLHNSLKTFATSIDTTPPTYSSNVSVEWNKWFEKSGDKLPKHLGKLKVPPASPPPPR